jgi:hypothetical protein
MLRIVVWLEWRNDRNGRTTGTIGIGTRNKRNVGWELQPQELQLLLGKGTVAVLAGTILLGCGHPHGLAYFRF